MPHNFSNTRTKSDNFGDGAISPVRNTPRVLTTIIFTQVVYFTSSRKGPKTAPRRDEKGRELEGEEGGINCWHAGSI